ncbi:glycoside hydrolase family 2 protein [Falsirhodobacter deserti]|uniref:glycoside hydrolase family 2 protein n=1 Tax=Falsirhodobacter deserti TaxID=1365611 RepID=UPI0019D487DD|nr:glycoside hydrolase family 2 TIM barrel-domain containing protein [Falsirhodobacter deserti]
MKLSRMRKALAAAMVCMTASVASAQDLRPEFVLTASHARASEDLSGIWTYGLDLYRTGLTDINGWVAKSRMQRFRDIDVEAEEAKGGTTLLEFDMDRGPQMDIPGAWNAVEPELRYYNGLVWFQPKFTPQAREGERAFLRFGAVNYKAYIYLNGEEVGRHEGGYTPFSLEVTDLLREGENRLVVGVDSEHDAQSIPTPITDWDLYGGITRPVELVYTPETFIDDATANLTTEERIKGYIDLRGPELAGQDVEMSIPELDLTATATTDDAGMATFDVAVPEDLELWSPETPKLYDVEFRAGEDTLVDRIGFRTVEVNGADILLNGEPIFLKGISMHEEEFGTNPARRITEQAARALLGEVKDGLGGNYVRLSHYPHSDVTVRLADEMGLLVWSEIPVYWTADWENPDVLRKAQTMQAEMIYRDRNRASVIIWSVGNETPVDDARTAFHNSLADTARELDPDRLISAALLVKRTDDENGTTLSINDPLLDKLDVLAVNFYGGWYGEDTLDDVAKMKWDTPLDQPLLFSEFGADAVAGFHDASVSKKFSEEYQAAFYESTLAMASGLPNLRGMSPWILKDFQSPRREHPVYQNGWNRKGLLSETGQKKMAYDVLADFYRDH